MLASVLFACIQSNMHVNPNLNLAAIWIQIEIDGFLCNEVFLFAIWKTQFVLKAFLVFILLIHSLSPHKHSFYTHSRHITKFIENEFNTKRNRFHATPKNNFMNFKFFHVTYVHYKDKSTIFSVHCFFTIDVIFIFHSFFLVLYLHYYRVFFFVFFSWKSHFAISGASFHC